MLQPVQLPIRLQTCWLSPQRCLYWEEKETLVIGGFQLGNFPESLEQPQRRSSLERMQEQLLLFKAQRILFIGGFPLPENNQYLEDFIQWRKRFQSLRIDFVLSRSSPVAESLLFAQGVHIHPGILKEDPFVWIGSRIAEEKWKTGTETNYLISGYEDPVYKKFGTPRQQPGVPAFYFTPTHGMLPAFSRPKGEDLVKPGKDELLWLTHQDHLVKKP